MADAGDRVRVHYTGRFTDGTTFDSSEGRDPIEFEVGAGEVIAGIDSAVRDMDEGAEQTVTVEPEEGYGEREEALTQTVERSRLPEGVDEGTALEADVNGQRTILWVTELGDEEAVVDANHPLAGKTLVFDLQLAEVVAH